MSSFVQSLLYLTISMSTPYILACMGGLFVQQTGVFNIALESMMTFGAFGAIVFVILFNGNLPLAYLMGILLSIVMAMLLAFFGVKLKGNTTLIGLALNMVAAAVPPFLMQTYFGSRGTLIATDFIEPRDFLMDVPVLKNIPILSDILNAQTPLTYFSFLSILICVVVLYKTRFGVYVRVTGENQEAAEAIGIKVDNYRYIALAVSGFTCGLAGINLSVELLGMYNIGLVAGRGFICLAAITCGRKHPLKTAAFALLFGFARAFQIKIATFMDPTIASLVGVIPFVTILFVLFATEVKQTRKNTIRIFQDN